MRLRHPDAAPIKAVTVNGREWRDFDQDKETVNLSDLTGAVVATVGY
ncbi:MAG: hypothetical protein AB1486_03120 [Planctomycetota bacterium]